MAEKALEKLADQLNCPICLQIYHDPKLLQCFHVYCQKCLVKLVARDQQGQLAVSCPICRQVSPVPTGRVAGLPPAFHISHLLDILQEHRRETDPPASADQDLLSSEGATATPPVGPSGRAGFSCSEHEGKEVELYCEPCAELVCWKCAIKGGKHHSHDHLLLSEAFEKYKEEVTPSLEPMEKQLTTIGRALTQLESSCGETINQRAAIEADINTSIDHLQEILAARKAELINQLHQLTQAKLKALATQRDQLETTQAQLSSCLEFMRESLKTDSHAQVLKMKSNLVKQVKELVIPFQPEILAPCQEAGFNLSFSPSLRTLCQNYGSIVSTATPDPSRCHLVDTGALRGVAVGAESTVLMQAMNYRGEPCEQPVDMLTCELVCEASGTTACACVKRRGESHYQISFRPTVKGRHQLHVKISNQHIKGSPFSISAWSSEVLGAAVGTVGGVAAPWGVAVGQSGEMVVSDLDGYCVTVFSPGGEKLASFGCRGCGPGQFESPCGVVFDHHGNIVITDCENHRIQKFSAEGLFLQEVGSFGVQPLQFMFPRGIALNPTNQRLYISEGTRIHVLNSNFTFSMTFGCEGGGCGQLSSPCGVACDSNGKVYVADSGNHRIQVFTARGQFLALFGESELYFPDGVTVDTSGLVYVSEGRNHRVSVFTSEGALVTTVGEEGQGEGLFTRPCGLALSAAAGSVLCVCDSGNKRLQLFHVVEHFFPQVFLYLHHNLNNLFVKKELVIRNLLLK